jgi:formate hydrogenlyase subunit 3/multisubunit Na+/H+ antiporter MnhD subunit
LDASAASPDDPRFITQATLAAGVGFVILLGVLPFHSWLAVVAEHAPPLASAFVFAVVQSGIVFLLLKSLNAYDWFGQNALVRSTMALAGLGMVLVGTLFALGQRNLGRSLGYVMMMDVGALLLALSAGTRIGTEAALATLTLRGFALALWSAGLNQLRRAAPDGADDVEALRGLAWRYPLATAATVFGVLALVGFPLTMGFPARLALMRVLAQTNLTAALALWLAMVSAGIVCVRAIAALVTPESPDVVLEFNESRVAMAYYGLGIALVLWLGAFPQWLLPAVAQAAQGFSLGP